MSCNTCDKAFTLLCREKGCPNCGFSYCSGCLKYKQNVDKLKKTVKVCAPCNRTLSNPIVEGAKPRSPPSALRKRMERLNSLPDTKHPITVYREGQITQLKRGLSTEDQHLADRLQQLKEPVGVTETDDEMQERLARLRGIDPAKASTASNSAIKPQPPKPDVLRAEELLEEIGAEIEIDEKMPDPDDEIAQRLAKLKGVDVDQVKNPGRKMSQNREESKTSDVDPESFLHDHSTYSATSKSSHLDNDTSENDVDPSVLVRELTKEIPILKDIIAKKKKPKEASNSSSSDDDEDEAEMVVAQVIDSLTLEEHTPGAPDEDSDEFKIKEFPWCIICNEDATLRCLECDGDLFCRSCFKECHKDADIRGHSSEPFKPREQKTL